MSPQLSLFDPEASALNAYRIALEDLAPELAAERRQALITVWPACPLEWEDDLNARLPDLVAEPMDLEPALARWNDFADLPLREKLGESRLKRLQHRFFRRLLDRNRLPSKHPRTREGRSMGWLCWRAGLLEDAKKLLNVEIRRFPTDPNPRLWLANCHFEEGDPKAARINYREALLTGIESVNLEEIADRDLAKFLSSSENEADWAVMEALVEGVLPPPRMTSREEFNHFLRDSAHPRPARQFYRCLVISLNRHLTNSATLLEARVQMRTLHPRLHAHHMRLLEQPAH